MIKRPHHILIVKFDDKVLAFTKPHLENEGYEVQAADDDAEMFVTLANGRPDLILLGLDFHNTDGIDILRNVRQHTTLPVIVTTGSQRHDDRLMALRLGADDYLNNPFDPRELILRVRNILRRTPLKRTVQ